jgi:hypothetical protein
VSLTCNLPKEESKVFVVKRDYPNNTWQVSERGKEEVYFTFDCNERKKFFIAFKEAYSNELFPPDDLKAHLTMNGETPEE